jgi:hypothetical protein
MQSSSKRHRRVRLRFHLLRVDQILLLTVFGRSQTVSAIDCPIAAGRLFAEHNLRLPTTISLNGDTRSYPVHSAAIIG